MGKEGQQKEGNGGKPSDRADSTVPPAAATALFDGGGSQQQLLQQQRRSKLPTVVEGVDESVLFDDAEEEDEEEENDQEEEKKDVNPEEEADEIFPQEPDFAVHVHDDARASSSPNKNSIKGVVAFENEEEEPFGHQSPKNGAKLQIDSNGHSNNNKMPSKENQKQQRKAVTSNLRNSTQKRKRKRGRVVRTAIVLDELETTLSISTAAQPSLSGSVSEGQGSKRSFGQPNSRSWKGLALPENHYETTLCRRAIRKRQDGDNNLPQRNGSTRGNELETAHDAQQEQFEIYGDVSLGMKLSLVGGKVIVQHLNALSDGRASPAQSVGVVQRGDVLLSVNNVSLVNLPIDQLMNGLGPLSSPDSRGIYQRYVKLRFAAGDGLPLLAKSEASKASAGDDDRRTSSGGSPLRDVASDVFAFFPMVDHMSGIPMFESHRQAVPSLPPPAKVEPAKSSEAQEKVRNNEPQRETSSSASKTTLQMDERISNSLATSRTVEREKFVSEFFAWNELHPKLMRKQSKQSKMHKNEEQENQGRHDASDARSEKLELGRRALMGARAISICVENVDKGKGDDVRSFKSWNTTLSLYSRASTRRRHVLDSASLPITFDRRMVIKEEDDKGDADDSNNSQQNSGSDEGECADGDELLLRLAAHDEIWRKQVVDYLVKAMDNDSVGEQKDQVNDTKQGGLEDFGSFLLGENMAKILTQNKRPTALPPDEITAVLFDLATKLSSTVPDELTTAGSYVSYRSSLTPFRGMKRPPPGSDAMLAARFVLDEALPAWLKSFRPLPWEQRRVLWPPDKVLPGESAAASTLSDNDTLTLDSMMSQFTVSKKKKNFDLREHIEDLELDAQTRGETCFLATFFFTQAYLPKLVPKKDHPANSVKATLNEISCFIKDYGAYLRLHTCLAYAAVLKAADVIDLLLDVAQHDPRHKEVMKHMEKANSLLLYDPTMLSAVLERLRNIQAESSVERRLATIDLCSAAYPDVRPWQVKRACLGVPSKNTAKGKAPTLNREDPMGKLYYTYLSLILHPMDGHDAARRDHALVQEWCELSVRSLRASSSGSLEGVDKPSELSKERRRNFFYVASRASSDHLVYHRDLVKLLKLSMEIYEYDLAIDLAFEILGHTNLSNDSEAVQLVLEYTRTIGLAALDADEDGSLNTYRVLKRILRLLRKAATNSSPVASRSFDVPMELLTLLKHRSKNIYAGSDEILKLIYFLADEAFPEDILKALACWTETNEMHSDVEPVLQTILRRGAHLSLNGEFSGSLLRVRRARSKINLDNKATDRNNFEDQIQEPYQSIWKNMSNGMVALSK